MYSSNKWQPKKYCKEKVLSTVAYWNDSEIEWWLCRIFHCLCVSPPVASERSHVLLWCREHSVERKLEIRFYTKKNGLVNPGDGSIEVWENSLWMLSSSKVSRKRWTLFIVWNHYGDVPLCSSTWVVLWSCFWVSLVSVIVVKQVRSELMWVTK